MKQDQVSLTFRTDRAISDTLKKLAHYTGKTRPQLIHEICKDYIENLIADLDDQVEQYRNQEELLKDQ